MYWRPAVDESVLISLSSLSPPAPRGAASNCDLILIVILQEGHSALATGKLELVPTSKTPQPAGTSITMLGASIPATKPQLTFHRHC